MMDLDEGISLEAISIRAVEECVDLACAAEEGVRVEKYVNGETDEDNSYKNDDDVVKDGTDGDVSLGHDRSKKQRSLDVQTVGQEAKLTFEDLQLRFEVIQGLTKSGFLEPSPIQAKAIPPGKFGYDLILQSKAGTGKTCAFGVIILHQLSAKDFFKEEAASTSKVHRVQALIVAPTREIACQNHNTIKLIGGFIPDLSVKIIIGGTSVCQSERRSQKCHVASGTPGRILHMIKRRQLDLSDLKIVVLDEADRLMEPSFLVDIVSIFDSLPVERQVIAASATYPDGLKDFVRRFMRDPLEITTDSSATLLAVTQYAADVNKILERPKSSSQDAVFENKIKVILEILRNIKYTQAIIFSRFVLRAEKICESLRDLSFDVVLLTGALSQDKRISALWQMQRGKCKILVTSDLGSRGLDCEGVDLVINFEIPEDSITYIHRYGRAGRFGTCGMSITLLSFASDYKCLSDYSAKVQLDIKVLESVQHIQALGESRQEKLRKLKARTTRVSINDPGNENWIDMLNYIMETPVDEPSFTLATLAGVNSDFDESKRSEILEARLNVYRTMLAQAGARHVPYTNGHPSPIN